MRITALFVTICLVLIIGLAMIPLVADAQGIIDWGEILKDEDPLFVIGFTTYYASQFGQEWGAIIWYNYISANNFAPIELIGSKTVYENMTAPQDPDSYWMGYGSEYSLKVARYNTLRGADLSEYYFKNVDFKFLNLNSVNFVLIFAVRPKESPYRSIPGLIVIFISA